MKKSFKISHYVSIIAALALVPIIILGTILTNNFITKGEDLREQHLKLADEAAWELSSYLEAYSVAISTLAQQTGKMDLTQEQIIEMAQELIAQYPGFSEIYLNTPHFKVSSASGLVSSEQQSEMEQLLRTVLDNTDLKGLEKPYLSPQVTLTGGRKVIFLVTPILDRAKNLDGYILGTFKLQGFESILSKHKIYPSGYAALIDSKSQIVIYTGDRGQGSHGDYPVITTMKTSPSGTMEYYSPANGKKEIASYKSVNDLGWGLWVAAPNDEVMKPQQRAAMVSVGFVLLGIVVILVIRRILVVHITRPLTILNLASQELAAGNLAFRVVLPEDYPSEIKVLGQRFNKMATNMEQTNKLLKVHSTQLELRVQERTAELLLKNKGLAALYAVASLVTSSDGSITEMLSTALKKAMNIFGAELGGVYLERSELGKLSYTVKRNFPGDEEAEKYIFNQIYFSCNHAVLSTDVKLKTVKAPHSTHNSQIAAIPIPHLIRNLGAIALTRSEPWKDEELVILQAMCKQLGVVVSNLSMFKYINEQNSTLLAVMNSIHEGLILYNAKGLITFANPIFLELFHLQGLKWQGLSVQELKERENVAATSCKLLIDLWENLIQDVGYGLKEVSFVFNDKTQHYRTYYFPVSSPDGFIGFGCLVRDITKEKEVEILKNTILSTVSHELRTPLTTIRGSAESLLRKDVNWSNEDKEEFVSAIVEESQRLRELIDNIMDMSKIEAGALNLDIQAVDITRLINRVVGRFQLRFPEVTFNIEYQPQLPMAFIDEGRIDQVLSNLLENGIKYSLQQAEITITTLYLEQLKKLEICVRDKGVGIDPKHHQEIFSRFYRVKNKMSKNVIGSGVGLSITKGIIEAHGGSIRVVSQTGQGSYFYVTIPCEEYKEELL